MRSSVGSEMPRKPGAMSWTNAGFSRLPYGVEKGEPNADQWNCATTIAHGSAPSRTPRARLQPPCRKKPARRIAAAGADGYSIATAAAQQDPEDDGGQDDPDPPQRENGCRFRDRPEKPEDGRREHARSGGLCREEPAFAVRRLQSRIVAHQRLVVDVAPLLEDRAGVAEARAAADRPAVLLGQRARRVDAHQLVGVVQLLEEDEE